MACGWFETVSSYSRAGIQLVPVNSRQIQLFVGRSEWQRIFKQILRRGIATRLLLLWNAHDE
jgi:hypothetical protein